MRTREILERKKKLFAPEDTASGIVPFERGAIGFSNSIAFQNALNHENQIITSEVTLFLAIVTICTQLVISVFFSSVIDHDPPTQIRRYYGMILTFGNYQGRRSGICSGTTMSGRPKADQAGGVRGCPPVKT